MRKRERKKKKKKKKKGTSWFVVHSYCNSNFKSNLCLDMHTYGVDT